MYKKNTANFHIMQTVVQRDDLTVKRRIGKRKYRILTKHTLIVQR